MDSSSLTLLNQGWALWIAFLFSLLLLSSLVGNYAPAKLAQYLLVGVSLGYLGVLLLQHVLRPRLWLPLWLEPLQQGPLWGALLLGVLLWVAAAERLWLRHASPQPKPWRLYVRTLGTIPAALMIGISLSTLLLGLLQGTFWPQFLSTAHSSFVWSTNLDESLMSVLVLLLTTASLLHWIAPSADLAAQQPRWIQQLLVGWRGLGKRALWFAAGVIFARLLAAHLSLLIGRLEFLLLALQRSIFWQWAESLWLVVRGG
ncbi:MAG: hypothetical protein KF832_30690 [Caldilineaceae bacterium]|nr:hypothetical protein [Caldilineaceae bacterium]